MGPDAETPCVWKMVYIEHPMHTCMSGTVGIPCNAGCSEICKGSREMGTVLGMVHELSQGAVNL